MMRMPSFMLVLSILWLFGWPAAHAATGRIAPEGALVHYFELAGTGFSEFDPNGVVLVDYGGSTGKQYNPVFIAQAALAYYYAFERTKDDQFKQRFDKQIAWLMKNAKPVGKRSDILAYEFPFPWGELKPGWRSGLAQAQGMCALIRAYYLYRDPALLPTIERLFRYMVLSSAQQGVSTRTPEGHSWIEEFPFSKPSHVLNGHIFAVFALYEYLQLAPKNVRLSRAYEQALEAVEGSLRHYDTGSWHNSDRHYRDPATDNYVRTHTEQLRWLHRITGNAFFARVRLRWLAFSMERSPLNRTNVVRRMDGTYYAPPEESGAGRHALSINDLLSYSSTQAMKGYGMETLFDQDPSTYFAPENLDVGPTNPHFIHLRFVKPLSVSGLRIRLYNPELYPREALIEVRATGVKEWRRLKHDVISQGRDMSYRFARSEVTEIRFSSTSTAGQNRLVLADLSLETDANIASLPDIGNYLSDTFNIEGNRFRVRLKTQEIKPDELAIQYRCTDNASTLVSTPWQFDFLMPDEMGPELPSGGAYCQFRITHVANRSGVAWSGFEVEPVTLVAQ